MSRNGLLAAWGLALGLLFAAATARAEPLAPPAALANSNALAPAPGNAAASNNDSNRDPSGHDANNAHEEADGHDRHGAVIADFEYLLLQPVRGNTDYAVVGSNPNWGPLGVVHNADGGFNSGFRIGAGYRWCNGCDVVFRYTYFHSTASDSVQGGNGIVIFPTRADPAVVNQVLSARAENSITVNLFDLEFGKRWQPSQDVWLRAFAGPRLASINQPMLVGYSGGEVASDLVHTNTTFSGGGLRGGGEVNYQFCDFLGLYGRGSASMLVGRFRSDLSETANNTVPIVNLSETFTRVVPVVELGAGLSFQMGNWRITAGYEFINWFNMINGLDLASDVSPGKLARRTGDLGFHGLALRVAWQY